MKYGLGRRREQKALGVEIGVAQKFVRGSVNLIGARLHDRVDDGAAHATIFRAIVAGDDFEFGDGVRRNLDNLRGEALVAGGVGVVVESVQQEIVVGAAHAVDVES